MLSARDAARLAAHLELSVTELLTAHTVRRAGRDCLATADDGYCAFYDHGLKGCGVHPARPDICRAWPFFRGNLIDAGSWDMIQEYCPGVNAEAGHAAFAAIGLSYVRTHCACRDDDDAPGALRIADL